MAHTRILLREDVDDLGARGEIVRVRSGYARNYLLPRKLAVEATASNVKQIEQERAALLKKEATERTAAEAQAEQIGKVVLEFKRKAGEQGALYGSVTSMDIAEALQQRGYEIDRHRIHLREPIKRLGEATVPLRLHREVTIDLQVKVAPEGEVIVGHLTPEQEAALAKQAEGASEEESAEGAE
ncbi:MAG TPA: 50S ribosomal protein L9 [Blastocatellia bacterium]|jgi:large subunit ribosomal protein L9|nr:50S ribosomal protein L9 [Blastocatellia bacterium]HCX29080.1 50S ribosomal protein L9 [Blastocatellia bacterium]